MTWTLGLLAFVTAVPMLWLSGRVHGAKDDVGGETESLLGDRLE